ncbi:MAG: hypothetical protein KatS3mg108_2070 [Isosphaeraceae bacterium]|jgi:dolichol-phosphate mannosyltransferase|nr:MAG: hypothetical protein KatS3mg108_2070 [Isosphaeraceae bacterium]
MAHVTLIIITEPDAPASEFAPADYCQALEASGHTVELVARPGSSRSGAAFAGLAAAGGDLLVVLDPAMCYEPADLPRVVEALQSSDAEVAVASRLTPQSGPFRAAVGMLVRWWTGSTDPLTGLIALTRSAYAEVAPRLQPLGSRFAAELIIKGRWRSVDVPVATDTPARRPRPGWSDLRHLKRLSDYRFGTLSRLVQFCIVGASGMLIDLTAYFALQPQFAAITALSGQVVPPTRIPVSLALARLTAIFIAMIWNFLLNRRLTFSDARMGGSLFRQFLTYAAGNALGVCVSLALSLGLPRRVGFFHDHKLAAAVVGIVAGTCITFTTARWVVFRRKPSPPPLPAPPLTSPQASPIPSTQPADA